MKYKFVLKDQYKKLKELYPEIEARVTEAVEADGCYNTFGDYLSIHNVVTGCYDRLWVSENFFEKEDNRTYFVKSVNTLSKVLNVHVLDDEQYKELQQAIKDQMGDSTSFVSVSLTMCGNEQHFNIAKCDIGEE